MQLRRGKLSKKQSLAWLSCEQPCQLPHALATRLADFQQRNKLSACHCSGIFYYSHIFRCHRPWSGGFCRRWVSRILLQSRNQPERESSFQGTQQKTSVPKIRTTKHTPFPFPGCENRGEDLHHPRGLVVNTQMTIGRCCI